MELDDADAKIGFVEFVWVIPAQGAEFPSLLDDRVKKTKRVKQFFEYFALFAAFEPLWVANGIAQIGSGKKKKKKKKKKTTSTGTLLVKQRIPDDVVSKPFRRFVGHLDSVLQDDDRKMIGRIGSQPQTEIWMGAVRRQRFADFLQRRHETLGQVAILQDHPCAAFYSLVDHPGSDGPLTLAQGQREKPACSETLIVGEFEQNSGRIGTRSQNEDQRNATVRVPERRSQIERRGLYKFFPHPV